MDILVNRSTIIFKFWVQTKKLMLNAPFECSRFFLCAGCLVPSIPTLVLSMKSDYEHVHTTEIFCSNCQTVSAFYLKGASSFDFQGLHNASLVCLTPQFLIYSWQAGWLLNWTTLYWYKFGFLRMRGFGTNYATEWYILIKHFSQGGFDKLALVSPN